MGSGLPLSSVARASNVCEASLSAAVVNGVPHGANAAESTRHSNVEFGSSETRPKVGVGSSVVAGRAAGDRRLRRIAVDVGQEQLVGADVRRGRAGPVALEYARVSLEVAGAQEGVDLPGIDRGRGRVLVVVAGTGEDGCRGLVADSRPGVGDGRRHAAAAGRLLLGGVVRVGHGDLRGGARARPGPDVAEVETVGDHVLGVDRVSDRAADVEADAVVVPDRRDVAQADGLRASGAEARADSRRVRPGRGAQRVAEDHRGGRHAGDRSADGGRRVDPLDDRPVDPGIDGPEARRVDGEVSDRRRIADVDAVGRPTC